MVRTPAAALPAIFLVGPIVGIASAALIVVEVPLFYALGQSGFVFPHAISIEQTREAPHKPKEMAETANGAKSAFLANMSHELRTPPHGILTLANFRINKSEKATPEKLKGSYQQVERSGKTLLALLDDLLDLAKLEAAEMLFTFHSVDLNVVLGTVADEIFSLAADRNLIVE